jgi:hypothetical protein
MPPSAKPLRLTPYVAPEDDLHVAVAAALRTLLLPDVLWTTWEARNVGAIEGAKRKARGVLAGWPDLGLMWEPRQAVFIELKRKRGIAPSDAQMRVHGMIMAIGFPVHVATSVDEVLAICTEYGVPMRRWR